MSITSKYHNPRNADELRMQELSKERHRLQAAIKKGVCLPEFVAMSYQCARLRVVNTEINQLYIKTHGL